MINYSVFKGARVLCNSYWKREIRKGLNETFFRDYSFTIATMQTKDYSFTTKITNLTQYEKITRLHLPTMKSLNAVPLNTSDTN